MELPGRLSKEFRGIIQSDEKVVYVLDGLRGQTAVLTDRRVIVSKGGVTHRASSGSKVTSYPFETIAGVEAQTTGIRTVLAVRSSELAGQGFVSIQTLDKGIWNAPNTVLLNRADRKVAQQFADHANRLKQESSRGGQRAGGAPQLSIADELGKLAQLRKAGVLSEEEFSMLKARLLS